MKITGIDELIAGLTKLNKEEQKQLKRIVKKNSQSTLAKSKGTSPVLTGKLKDSLEVRFEKQRTLGKAVINVTSKAGQAVDKKGRPYLQFITYGRKKGKKGSVPANPFLKNAIESSYETIKNEMSNDLLSIFDGIVKGK